MTLWQAAEFTVKRRGIIYPNEVRPLDYWID